MFDLLFLDEALEMNGIWILFENLFLIVEMNLKKIIESDRIFMRDLNPGITRKFITRTSTSRKLNSNSVFSYIKNDKFFESNPSHYLNLSISPFTILQNLWSLYLQFSEIKFKIHSPETEKRQNRNQI